MDSLALFTFVFTCQPAVQHVELFGSWDNFQEPYPMKQDRRRGSGVWTGCFRFGNIVCDGDKLCWDQPRDGCLKQGGRYWYYYRCDLDVETIDDAVEHSIPCPLMPGQTLNVLDVPREIRCFAACAEDGVALEPHVYQTLNPLDKFSQPIIPSALERHARRRPTIGRLRNGRKFEQQPSPTYRSRGLQMTKSRMDVTNLLDDARKEVGSPQSTTPFENADFDVDFSTINMLIPNQSYLPTSPRYRISPAYSGGVEPIEQTFKLSDSTREAISPLGLPVTAWNTSGRQPDDVTMLDLCNPLPNMMDDKVELPESTMLYSHDLLLDRASVHEHINRDEKRSKVQNIKSFSRRVLGLP